MLSSVTSVRVVASLLVLLLAGFATVVILPDTGDDRLRINDLELARLAQTPDGRARLERDARDHLMSEPLSARALRQLGTARALDGDDVASERLHMLAERVSRRDLGTQLWLIERAAAAGDVAETLRHYDLALTSEPASGELLYPVLASAIEDEAVRSALAPYVRADRPWVRSFLAAGLEEAMPSALSALVAVARPDTVKGIMGTLLTRMARDQDFVSARKLLMATPVGRAASGDMTVSDRTTAPQLGPFGWQLGRSDGVDAVRDGGGLTVRISSGASGLAARRVLILRPGRYRLGYAVQSQGVTGTASLSADAQCLGGPGNTRLLSAGATEARDVATLLSHQLTVPAGCGALAIAFRVIGGDGQQEEMLRIDRITFTSVAGA